MDSRQQFEEWVVGRKVVKKHGAKLNTTSDGTYCDYRINDRWLAWQASRAGIVIELPEPVEVESVGIGCTMHDEYFDIDEIKESLQNAGLNYK